MSGIRVLVADDQELIRGGLVALIRAQDDMEVVGEAADGERALAETERAGPDVVLMDIRMPVMDGIEATRRMPSGVRVLVLTTFDIDEHVFEALRAGAAGFLLKDTPPAELIDAIRTVAAGEALLDPTVTQRLIDAYVSRPATPSAPSCERLDDLTERETEVLRLVAQGLSNRDISARLHVSDGTVKTHLNRVMGKLGLTSRAQAVVVAYESGLVIPGQPWV
ncbi:response regulator transcription factor [Spongiactinospora sp. TRM90649]|uniref:response regulator n=1 Tax=Spongiactinospora sp. TRM90649 TaxID=3031114 RepID=UPI0023F85192|nr:response regulator transcription factor [Spongiactinospora sp. TRM90649]MDF5753266.1 response regulator transcription factor [Spongiactinospora sp. TRM90649]